jgi:hypothetical protein
VQASELLLELSAEDLTRVLHKCAQLEHNLLSADCVDLVVRMLRFNPSKRPTLQEVCYARALSIRHCQSWAASKALFQIVIIVVCVAAGPWQVMQDKWFDSDKFAPEPELCTHNCAMGEAWASECEVSLVPT